MEKIKSWKIMQPYKDKSLYYFLLEDEDQGRVLHSYGSEHSLTSKAVILGQLLDKKEYASLDIYLKQRAFLEKVGDSIKQRYVSSGHYRLPFQVKFLEKVINYRGYQHSVDFTIGNSIKKKETDKFLVGIEAHPEQLKKMLNSISKPEIGFQAEFKQFSLSGIFLSYNKSMGYGETKINLSCNLFESDNNFKKVSHYSYDDNFKYYTLLCS